MLRQGAAAINSCINDSRHHASTRIVWSSCRDQVAAEDVPVLVTWDSVTAWTSYLLPKSNRLLASCQHYRRMLQPSTKFGAAPPHRTDSCAARDGSVAEGSAGDGDGRATVRAVGAAGDLGGGRIGVEDLGVGRGAQPLLGDLLRGPLALQDGRSGTGQTFDRVRPACIPEATPFWRRPQVWLA